MSNNQTEIKDAYSKFKTDIMEIFEEKDKIIEKLKLTNRKMEEVNTALKTRILSHEEELSKGKFCLHCHSTFIPKFNDEVRSFLMVEKL